MQIGVVAWNALQIPGTFEGSSETPMDPLMATVTAHQELLPEVQAFLDTPLHKAFIGGTWVEARSGATFEVLNPGTGERLATVTSLQKDDVDAAVDAAVSAFDGGATCPAKIKDCGEPGLSTMITLA